MKSISDFKIANLVLTGILGGSVVWASDKPPVASVPGQTEVTAPTPQPPQLATPVNTEPVAPATIVREKNGVPLLIVEFETDRSDIPAAFIPQLNAFGKYLHKHPESTAEVAGHADNSGHGPANDALSQKRANAVMAYLVKNYGISLNRINAVGYGALMDKPDNSTVAAQQYDRRVYGTIKTTKS